MAENPYQYLMDDEQDDNAQGTGSAWDNYQPWDVAMPAMPDIPTPVAAPTTGVGQQPSFSNGNIDPGSGRPMSYPGAWGVFGNYGPMGQWGIPTMYEDSTGQTTLNQKITNMLNRNSISQGKGLAIPGNISGLSGRTPISTGPTAAPSLGTTAGAYIPSGGYGGVPATPAGDGVTTIPSTGGMNGYSPNSAAAPNGMSMEELMAWLNSQPTSPSQDDVVTGGGTRSGTGVPAGPPTQNPAPDGGWQTDPDTGEYVSQPGWIEGVDYVSITDPSTGQVTQYPLPLRTQITPQNIEYWLQDDQTLKGLQTYFQSMTPYMQAMQNAYQWQNEFNQANQRYWYEQPWQQQLEGYNAALSGRQQYMNELLARDSSNQWQQEFGRAQSNDAFAQEVANRELAMAEERMGRELTLQERQQVWQETYQTGLLEAREKDREAELQAARYAAFGRSSAPARWVASWG